jgi:hypothetical protein
LTGLLGFSVVVNLVLLIPFCLEYSHRGLVEPLVRVEKSGHNSPYITLITPEAARIFPFDYGGLTVLDHSYARDWAELADSAAAIGQSDYYFLYPNSADDLPAYVDSINSHVGEIRQVFRVGPSMVDYVAHVLNRRNKTNEVWVFEPAD